LNFSGILGNTGGAQLQSLHAAIGKSLIVDFDPELG